LDVCLLGTHGTVRVVLRRVANASKGAKYIIVGLQMETANDR